MSLFVKTKKSQKKRLLLYENFGILHRGPKVVYTLFEMKAEFQCSGFSVQVSVFRFQVSVFRFQCSGSAVSLLTPET